ncbi:MAG: CvpA family protein [Clostridiales bacterium]|nr:CvpA family protein [Clostridiales bacterium]
MSTLSIVFDVGVLLLVVICVWRGITRGFIQSMFRLGSTVLSLFLAKWFYPYTQVFLEKILIKDVVKSLVLNRLNLSSGTTDITEYSVNSLNLPSFIKTAFLNSEYLSKIKNDASATLASTISDFVADYSLTILAYIITFILATLAVFFILAVLNIFSKLPVVHFFNVSLGGVSGLLTACIIIWVILAALNFFAAIPGDSVIYDAINNSVIARVFYEYNPINLYLLK